ncbi:MAG: hypothetical protein FWB98_02425 [Defluviitaleaceae bacterium]|nr:hypothetical protein [Defluviitaleaceae bacterium]
MSEETQVATSIDRDIRKQIMQAIRISHKKYLSSLEADKITLLEKRFKNLYIKLRNNLSRKEFASLNSLKGIPLITKIISGLHDDIKRLGLKEHDFKHEILLLCRFVRARIEQNLDTKYDDQCNYSESLLNCYLDLMISLTTRKSLKEIEAYPDFLVNPITNQKMELDVLFEGFKIAFEFQGETHYTDEKTKVKDREKLLQCSEENIILVPINAFQLNSSKILDLIANSIKDFLNLGLVADELINRKHTVTTINCSKAALSNYFKVLQRLKVATLVFGSIFEELDVRAVRYIETQSRRSPITTSTNAPRAFDSGLDHDFRDLYMVVPNMNKVSKGQSPKFSNRHTKKI